jgi:DNA (cytosine-5)-methyltransferase 1
MEDYAMLEFIDEQFQDKLRVGTDCSGIEAPIQALRQLGIPFKHVFSSEIDKYCIQSIKANYHPEILFGDPDGPYPEGDITKRDISLVPDIDLYVCGFPCQPFSVAGKRKGLDDKRGNVFWGCLDVIKTKQPKYFILENVRGLLNHDKGNTWQVIWEELEQLKESEYEVQWKVLNTKDYGIPQNRERIYIVGSKNEFEWPSEKEMESLEKYIDHSDQGNQKRSSGCQKIIDRLENNPIYINIGFPNNAHATADKICPTLTTRSSHIWNERQNRYANAKEFLMLQGFTLNWCKVVSTTQIRRQLGNSMSVNVLKALLSNLL